MERVLKTAVRVEVKAVCIMSMILLVWGWGLEMAYLLKKSEMPYGFSPGSTGRSFKMS